MIEVRFPYGSPKALLLRRQSFFFMKKVVHLSLNLHKTNTPVALHIADMDFYMMFFSEKDS